MTNKILKKIFEAIENPTKARNSMGCSEDNYNPYFLIGKCFSKKKLNTLTDSELKNLVKLATYSSEVFY